MNKVIACLLLAIVLLLRVRDRTAASEPAEQSVIETTEETYAVEETETGKNEAAPTPSAVLTEAIAETEETPVPAEKAYNAETYQIVSDMVYLCRSETPDREGQIQALLESLEEGAFPQWTDVEYKDGGWANFEFSHFEVDLREPDSQYRTLYVVYRYDTTAS